MSFRWCRFLGRWFLPKSSRWLSTIAILLSLILTPFLISPSPSPLSSPSPSLPPSPSPLPPALLSTLPPPQPHPLPPNLATRQDSQRSGDYFDQVQPSIIGYLIWTQFPITVYIQPPTDVDNSSPFTAKRAQIWIKAVQTAVQDWHPYLPLQQVEQATGADIAIWRSTPPLRLDYGRDRKSTNANSGSDSKGRTTLPTLRARSAETQFELYSRKSVASATETRSLLAHRMIIYIRPDQSFEHLQAAARHELGHALGIWGHSPNSADTMYFSQVRNPAKISSRDINTLKRIYQQPTRLGWPMTQSNKD